MKKHLLTLAALQSIAALNPEGSTIDKNTLQPITKGFSVAVEDTQNSFNTSGAKRVIRYAKCNKHINAVGGWLNSENGKYYYDAVIVCNTLDEAIILGKANKQLAIFDLNNLHEIRL